MAQSKRLGVIAMVAVLLVGGLVAAGAGGVLAQNETDNDTGMNDTPVNDNDTGMNDTPVNDNDTGMNDTPVDDNDTGMNDTPVDENDTPVDEENDTPVDDNDTETEIDHIAIEPVPSSVSVGDATELNVTFRDDSDNIVDVTRNFTLMTDLGVFNESGGESITLATSATHEGSPAHGHTHLTSEEAGTATVQAQSENVSGSATVTFVANETDGGMNETPVDDNETPVDGDDGDAPADGDDGKAKQPSDNDTPTDGDGGDGKAKQPSDGEDGADGGDGGGKSKTGDDGNDGAADGGNGKTKASDGGDGDDTADGSNGKSKAD